MAVPVASDPCWKRLASGAIARLNTTNLSAQLMIKRLERSQASTAEKAAEIYAFFAKWERILGSEVQQIARL